MGVIKSTPLNYVVSTPLSGKSDGLPVLCFLHGDVEAAPMDIEMAAASHGPLREGNPPQVTEDFIVVVPQLPAEDKGNRWYKYADAVRDLVRQVQVKYGGNPKQTYLTGFSFGANGVFDIALSTQGFWSALWPVDPTRVPKADPKCPTWLSLGEKSRDNKNLFLKVVPASAVEGNDYVYEDRNLTHVETATSAYKDAQVYAWLKNKHL